MLHILTSRYEVLDPYFGRGSRPVELDMGCGKGGLTLTLAQKYPDRLILGSDIMVGRLRRIARKAERRGLENVELLRVENLALAAYFLPPDSVHRIHLLCPDPWPKGRHRHNRLVTTDFLSRLVRILVSGGILHLSTDHFPYFEVWRQILNSFDCLVEDPSAIEDIADFQTEFEKKWLAEGKTVPHMAFRCST